MATKLSTLRLLCIILAVIGIVLPYSAFLPFLFEHGLNLPLFVEQAAATRIALFAWLDVLVTAVTLLVVTFGGGIVTIRQALIVTLFTCAAGSSAGLPLFFYFFFTNASQKK